MSSPRKKFNYQSPYSSNLPQYPSQSTSYVSQHAGGNLPHPAQQDGFYEDKQGIQEQANVPHFYQNRPQHERQFGNHRGRNFGQHGRQFGQQHGHGRQYHDGRRFSQQNQDKFSLYFHNSMLEDPWKDLMARHQAIHNSVLCDSQDKDDKA
ncbi:uncharacterized protein LOC115623102 [Scaptodrosophila lebanonensis]|uniref:Uncharacterized protein LOC115623102 n=1 Tax=Drosophila lebanonensis TaxID=7225 RepID=A0A6J2TDU5_DROLE|nr:uncharacterized protein LOC115623102 [Scaptodrosophila lebanonensis]